LRFTPETFRQRLRLEGLRSELGIDQFAIVELKEFGDSQVVQALRSLPADRAQIMSDYLSASDETRMEVRRPLLFQMLIDLDGASLPDNEPFSTYELYRLYADTLLEREAHRSLIPTPAKRRILELVARDMFASQRMRADARISRDDLKHAIS